MTCKVGIVAALSLLSLAAAEKGSILAVFAHPDDETAVGPALAKYARAGHDVYLVSITSGQKGVTPSTTLVGEELGRAREEELRCSAKKLGIHPPFLWQFQDQGISVPPVMEQIAARLREIINQSRPDVIITWGPDGVTGHPDHRTAGALATQVFQQRSLLEHKPKKLYYIALPESKFPDERAPSGRPPFRTVSDLFVTTEIEAAATMDAAAAAIRCHKTQWDAGRMKQMESMFRETLGSRLFLRLALSETPLPLGRHETDLFEGIGRDASPQSRR